MTQADIDLLRRLFNGGKWTSSRSADGHFVTATVTLDVAGMDEPQVTQLVGTLQKTVKDLVEEVARLREHAQIRR